MFNSLLKFGEEFFNNMTIDDYLKIYDKLTFSIDRISKLPSWINSHIPTSDEKVKLLNIYNQLLLSRPLYSSVYVEVFDGSYKLLDNYTPYARFKKSTHHLATYVAVSKNIDPKLGRLILNDYDTEKLMEIFYAIMKYDKNTDMLICSFSN